MEKQLEEKIRERAYELWMQNGCLANRADEYWYQAERELLGASSPEAGNALGSGAEDAGSRPDMGATSEPTLDVSAAPLGMVSQTSDEILPSIGSASADPALPKTRRKRAPAGTSAQGSETPEGPPRRKRSDRTTP